MNVWTFFTRKNHPALNLTAAETAFLDALEEKRGTWLSRTSRAHDLEAARQIATGELSADPFDIMDKETQGRVNHGYHEWRVFCEAVQDRSNQIDETKARTNLENAITENRQDLAAARDQYFAYVSDNTALLQSLQEKLTAIKAPLHENEKHLQTLLRKVKTELGL